MGADTYDAFYIAKAAIESAGTVDKATVRSAIEQTNLNDMLIITQTGKIQFSTGVNYHEIDPVTFIEQLQWSSTLNQLKPVIVWPATVPGVGTIKQADFTLPTGYQSATNTTSQDDSTTTYIIAAIAAIVVIAILAVVLLRRKKKVKQQ
jgi:LPXTG-motif cell wall-anchored protein